MTITLDEPLVMPVADEGIDMSWVVFSDDDPEEACERVHPPCDKVATHKVWYQPDNEVPNRECSCGTHSRLLCGDCFDKLTSGGLVACAKCSDEKDYFKKIVYSERLR